MKHGVDFVIDTIGTVFKGQNESSETEDHRKNVHYKVIFL